MTSPSEYLTQQDRDEIGQGLDAWVAREAERARQEFDASHQPPPPAGDDLAGGQAAQPPVGGDIGSPQPPPAGPVEYQVAHVRIPESDADRVARIYTFMRNNPERAGELEQLLVSPPPPPAWQQPTPPAAPPAFTLPPQLPAYQPPPTQTYYPPQFVPPASTYPALPAGLDLEDPTVKFLLERDRTMQAQLEQTRLQYAQMQEDANRRAAETQADQARQLRQQMILTEVTRGSERFKAAHPEINPAQHDMIQAAVVQTNIMDGLSKKMPWDQATEEAMELVAPRVLQMGPGAAHTPTDAARQRTLTALSGSTGSVGSRGVEQPPAPRPGPKLERQEIDGDQYRQAALTMVRRSGASLASTL